MAFMVFSKSRPAAQEADGTHFQSATALPAIAAHQAWLSPPRGASWTG
jgi:hypothetical protein